MNKTSDFSFFCSTYEAHYLVGSVLCRHQRILSFFDESGEEIQVFEGEKFSPKERIVWTRILKTPLNSNTSHYLNAIQLIFPEEAKTGLLMGVIAIKYDDKGTDAFKLYSKIKRQMLNSMKSGVRGINRVNNSDRLYRNIYYSDYAKNISRDGVDLLTRYGEGNVYYKID
jgi:hypothetical protein